MHSSTTLTHTNRIEIADVLRGFAVLGITLIHYIRDSLFPALWIVGYIG